MTTRLYYTDSYLTTFTATVTDVVTVEGRSAVVLDRTEDLIAVRAETLPLGASWAT